MAKWKYYHSNEVWRRGPESHQDKPRSKFWGRSPPLQSPNFFLLCTISTVFCSDMREPHTASLGEVVAEGGQLVCVHRKLILPNLLILGSRCKVKFGPRAVKNRNWAQRDGHVLGFTLWKQFKWDHCSDFMTSALAFSFLNPVLSNVSSPPRPHISLSL